MNKRHLYGAATALMLLGGSTAAFAEGDTLPQTTQGTAQTIDAATIVGQDLYDPQGNDIGDIDAVLVNADGMVQSVVADVSGWLESEKLINLNWSDLAQGPDGQIIATTLTKEQAEAAEGYAYRDGSQGGVLLEDGQPYTGMPNADVAAAPAGDSHPESIMNSDGTVNTSNVVGAAVENTTGDKLGEVNEVVLQPDGDIQGVVVDVGGLLGLGAHSVLLDWEQVELIERDGREILTVNATEDSLKQMPEYKAPAAN